jgi:hypothetical protein
MAGDGCKLIKNDAPAYQVPLCYKPAKKATGPAILQGLLDE